MQKTPKDKKASLVVHGLVDKVLISSLICCYGVLLMEKVISWHCFDCFLDCSLYCPEQVIAGVMDRLDLQIPPFVRIDLVQTILTQAVSLGDYTYFLFYSVSYFSFSLLRTHTHSHILENMHTHRFTHSYKPWAISFTQLVMLFVLLLSHGLYASFADKKYVNWNLRIGSVHGDKAPLPFVKSVEVSHLALFLSVLLALCLRQTFSESRVWWCLFINSISCLTLI